jgi:hypothetical protein
MPWNQPIGTVTLMFREDVLKTDNQLLSRLNILLYSYDLIERIIFTILIILILIQLKKLITSIRGKTFFENVNIKIIKNLSILVGIWVGFHFLMYHLLWLFIPENLVVESINFISLQESFFSSILVSIDFKMLFVAIILYIISVSFKEGYSLKEQTELTI